MLGDLTLSLPLAELYLSSSLSVNREPAFMVILSALAGRAGARIVGTMQGGDTEEDVSNHPMCL